MSWHEYHSESEKFASDAEVSVKQGNARRANELYRLAAEAEMRALEELDPEKARTIGITAVSAAALYYKAGDHQRAKDIAERWFNNSSIPPFAADQLGDILRTLRDDPSRTDLGRIDKSSDHTSAGEAESGYSASLDDLSLHKLHNLMSQLIMQENELLDELHRVPLTAKNQRNMISLAIPLFSILLLVAGGLYLVYLQSQIKQDEYSRQKGEQDRRLKESQLEVLRLQATVQIIPYLIQSGKYDKDSALRRLNDLLDPATLDDMAPMLKNGNAIEAITKATDSDNQKARDAAEEILGVLINGKGNDRTIRIYRGTPNETIRVQIEPPKQPSKLSATLNGKELSVVGNALTFNLKNNIKQTNLLQLIFQGNLGDKYKVRILGGNATNAKITYLIEQENAEVPSTFIFTTG